MLLGNVAAVFLVLEPAGLVAFTGASALRTMPDPLALGTVEGCCSAHERIPTASKHTIV